MNGKQIKILQSTKVCSIKVKKEKYMTANYLSKDIFGDWFQEAKKAEILNSPFDHIVIDNFFNIDLAHGIYADVQKFSDEHMWVYENAFEIQRVMNKWDQFGSNVYQTFFHLCSQEVANFFGELFNLTLKADVGLHGGGMVLYPNGGKLNVHLEYETHPKLNRVRNLNLLVYLNPNWDPAWGGGINLYQESENEEKILARSIDCIFNRAVLFNTDQNSWHGLPEKIKCPNDQARTVLNFYYLDDSGKKGLHDRFRAKFIASKEQGSNKKEIEELAKLRMDKSNPKYN